MKQLIGVLFLLAVAGKTFAQVNVTAKVDKGYVAIGQQIELTIWVAGTGIEKLTKPSLSDFEIVSGPNSSTSIEYNNGVKTESGSYSYTLKAIKAGTFTIGSATVTDSGNLYKSIPVVIVVVDSIEEEEEIILTEEFVEDEEAGGVPGGNTGTIYFKDGKPFENKEEFMTGCLGSVERRGKTSDLKVKGPEACQCMLETIARNFTYDEFTAMSDSKQDMMTALTEGDSPVFNEVIKCVTTNLDFSSTNETKSGKTPGKAKPKAKNKQVKPDEDFDMEDLFVEACKGEFKNNKKYKNLSLNADAYCQCTWNKIQEHGISMTQLGELSDPNSDVFMKVITPCLSDAFGSGTKEEKEAAVKNPADILGENATERVALTGVMGIYKIRVKIGSVEKFFTLDSGASEVFISPDLERELLMDGRIKKDNYLTSSLFVLANGEQVKCRRVKLSNVVVGGYVVNNVVVAINEGDEGLLLLGKSFLDKFSSWSIDNSTKELVLTR